MSLDNKVVIITGGSSGIGATTAISFAREGANVIIVGRNEENLHKIAEKCSEVGKNPLVIKADVTKDTEASTVIEKTIKKFGKLDILVNNAGIFRHSSIIDSNYVEIYDATFNVNLRSAFVLTHLAVPYLLKTKGNIVNVSSVLSTMRVPGYSAYSASKAALTQFTRATANELAEKGVRVNAISPGPVETHLFDLAGTDISWEYLKSFTAMNKVSKPEEVAELIIYLASDKACSVTGSDFLIDCGTAVKQ